MQTQRAARSMAQQNSIVISPDGFRLVKLRQDDTQSGNKKLGFSLRGGREATGSSVGVFVSHVELAGQASKNGLKVGDQLIQVNGLQVSQATYEEVIELIRRAPKCDEICLLVKYVGKIPFQERTGEPIRWLQIESEQSDAIDRASTNPQVDADEPHLLLLNDLDGDSTKLNCAADERLKMSPNVSGVREKRQSSSYQDDSAASSQSLTFTSGASSSCSGASIKDDDDDDDDEEEEEEEEAEITLLHVVGGATEEEEEEACQLVSSAASSSSGCSISMSSVQSGQSTNAESARDGATPVRVPGGRRTSEPFGCGVVKGPDEWPGIFVQNVKPASLAERVGLEPGDQLVQAGNQELSRLPFEEAIALIKSLQQQQDELLLLVRKGAALRHLAECKWHQHQQQQHHDLKARRPALSQRAMGDAQNRRRKPLEPPPAPPSRPQQQVAIESVSCAHDQQQQQVGQTKSFKGDSQPAIQRPRQGQKQKQADSSIRLDGAASGPIGEQRQPCQRRQTTTTKPVDGNAKSQHDQSAAIDCTNANDDDDERQPASRLGHAKPEDKNESADCTKTIGSPLAPHARMPPPPADRHDAEDAMRALECSAERERQCNAGRGAPSSPSPSPSSSPADRLPSTRSSLGARQQRAPTARRPTCSSSIVAQQLVAAGQRQRKQQQVAASDNDDAKLPSSSLVVNHRLQTHESPRSMKLNYYNSAEGEEDEDESAAVSAPVAAAAAAAGANQRDDLATSRSCNSCCHRSGTPNNETSNANEQHTSVAGKTRAVVKNQRSQARNNKQDERANETMRLAIKPRALEDLEDARDERDLQEEIKIVKQNCKLHHYSSMHSLVNSRLFLTTNDLKQRGAPGSAEAAKEIKSKTHRAPPPPPPARALQRYVSMDNLSGPQQQMQHNHLLMLQQQQQQQQQQLNRYKRVGCQTSRQRNAAPQLPAASDSRPTPFYRRSNSVLGQPLASCCPLTQHQHHLLLHDRQATHKQIILNSRASACNCHECQQAVVTSKTMRHAPRVGPPPVSRPCSVTLSKFKARSEDKLNLMHMNLNYMASKQQQQVINANNCASGSARQARQSAFAGKRHHHHDSAALWLPHHQHRAPTVKTSGAACCAASSSSSASAGLLRPIACHLDVVGRGAPTPPQLVYNYATATGMIATGRVGGSEVSSAASCCAINELTGEQLARARKPNRTSEFLLLEQHLLMQQQLRHPATCCSSCCCSSSSSFSSPGPSGMRPIKSSMSAPSQTAFRACKSAQPKGSGASTDSSGYQSTSGGERLQGRVLACLPAPSQQRDTRGRLSTFNPQPCSVKRAPVAPAAPRPSHTNLPGTPSIEISSSCGSSGSLGSATCSPSSSSDSSSCSPLSSPHYLSSPSSCSTTAHGKPSLSGASRASGHYEISQVSGKIFEKHESQSSPKLPKLLRSKLLGGPALAAPSREHIPCPPPMPSLDDNSQTLRAPTAAGPGHHKRKDQSGQLNESDQPTASKPTSGGGGKSNKLCFVDELKMLASQQAATESTNGAASGNKGAKSRGAQQPGESATLIKIINANKQTAALRGNKCSCCPVAAGSECLPRGQCAGNLSEVTAATSKNKCCYSSKSTAGGCHRGRPSAGKPDGSSAASKLRDEEYTRRRQHELLMEEFKTAHSKMFNKLRQKQTDNSKSEQQQEIAGDVYDDDQDKDDRVAAASAQSMASDDMGQQQQRASDATAAASENLIIRPRTTVATN